MALGTRRGGVALLLLLAIAVQAPFFARGLSLLDEGTVAATADALARGETLYRDRVTIIAPLVYELLAAGYRAFGAHVAVGRALQAAVFASCVLLAFAVLRRAAGERWAFAGALLLLALKPLGFFSWTIANYSPLGLLALLLALAALARWLETRRRRDLALVGIASGLVFVAKQNLAAVAAFAVGGAVLAAWWAAPPRRPRRLAAEAGVLAAAAAVPLVAAALHYASHGALRPAVAQLVTRMPAFADAWLIPFPPLLPWQASDPDAGLRIFAFLPQPVVELALAGGLGHATPAALRAAEWGVKACYALPLAAIGLLCARWLGDARRRAERTLGLACALFAAGAYASMVYRPDWAHLMNVWPLLHVAIVAAVAAERGRVRAVFAGTAAFVWLALALAAAGALAALDWETLRTPRGTLRVSASLAPAARALLAWDAARPAAERIAYLPAVPGLHFLTARPLPLAVDALLPGTFGPDDEERMLAQLASVERIVFDEKALPGVRADAVDAAPRLARALAAEFRFERVVAPGFYAFARARPAAAGPRERLDLAAGARPGATLEHWLFQRVLAWQLAQPGDGGCVESAWRAAPGDRVVAAPLAHPALWASPHAAAFAFELSVLGPDGAAVAARSETLPAGPPAEPWRVPVELPEGAEAAVRLCARLVARAEAAQHAGKSSAGWAEPHVERGAAD
jgi:hypothetical protein